MENLEEGYSIDSVCDTNVSRYFASGRYSCSTSRPDSNHSQALRPRKLARSTRKQEKSKGKQRVFSAQMVQTTRPGIHLHKPVKA
ncbi:hypothetical protein N026_13165 [Pseudomonas syringae UB303]|uniref:Uncharacterized protein n=1 Tax=Pseudomonas syringae UB303 TaxID=1357287 RepID=A0AAJ4B445_PSESX|nr:hypothetical protein N026_13165 [Pseudomonas syringae UB303]